MNKKWMTFVIAVVMAAVLLLSSAVAQENDAWMPEWNHSADVVIVGYGPAGAMAAKSAMENGASVLVVEKCNKEFAGGSSVTSGGYIKWYSPEEIYKSAVGQVTMENAQRIYDTAKASVDWLLENGMQMSGQTIVGNGKGYYEALMKSMEPLNVDVLYETPAEKLISDPMTKEVYGVQCTNASGEKVFVKANKGVILCTGGYAANKELMTRFHFSEPLDYAVAGAPTQTGDGLLMAVEAGAGVNAVTDQQIEWYGFSYKTASDEMGTAILHTLGNNCSSGRIFVNSKGERFMDEELWVIHSKFQMPFMAYDGTFPNYNGYMNLPMYTIFDSSVFDGDAVGPRDFSDGYASNMGIYNWSADNKAELERGWLVKADTIEELVEKLAQHSGNAPIDIEGLKNTIAKYNAYCEKGEDEEFGRNALLMSPIEKGPYYAAQVVPTIVYTIGGLLGGENGETLDWQGNPIPRLYHAGDIGQPTKMVISALQGCMALGSIAGEACSQLESH